MTGQQRGIRAQGAISACDPGATSASDVSPIVLEQASALLDREVNSHVSEGYQALLLKVERLREHEVTSPEGERFSVCIQVLRPNGLECTLELRASVQWLRGDEVIPLPLRMAIAVTPDGEASRL